MRQNSSDSLYSIVRDIREMKRDMRITGLSALSLLTAPQHIQAGTHATRNCRKCHERLEVSYESASFQQVAAPSATGRSGGQKGGHTKASPSRGGLSETQRRAAKRDALVSALEKLAVGQPLPNRGTCKHYAHSHRCALLALVTRFGR